MIRRRKMQPDEEELLGILYVRAYAMLRAGAANTCYNSSEASDERNPSDTILDERHTGGTRIMPGDKDTLQRRLP